MALFAVQAAFSGMGLAFCFWMLYTGASPSIYLPMVTGIISAWLPTPLRQPPTGYNPPPV